MTIDKQVRVKPETFDKLQQLAKELAAERGRPKENLTDVVAEAVHFYIMYRKKAELEEKN